MVSPFQEAMSTEVHLLNAERYAWRSPRALAEVVADTTKSMIEGGWSSRNRSSEGHLRSALPDPLQCGFVCETWSECWSWHTRCVMR